MTARATRTLPLKRRESQINPFYSPDVLELLLDDGASHENTSPQEARAADNFPWRSVSCENSTFFRCGSWRPLQRTFLAWRESRRTKTWFEPWPRVKTALLAYSAEANCWITWWTSWLYAYNITALPSTRWDSAKREPGERERETEGESIHNKKIHTRY